MAGAGHRGGALTVGFSADLGYARPDTAVAGRLRALAAAGMIRLREVTVRLADPAAGWLPLAAFDRGQLTDLSQVTRAHEVRRHNDRELAALFGDVDVLVTPTTRSRLTGCSGCPCIRCKDETLWDTDVRSPVCC